MAAGQVVQHQAHNDQPTHSGIASIDSASGTHIPWSPWAQKRLLRIGLPLAGLLALCAPSFMLLANTGGQANISTLPSGISYEQPTDDSIAMPPLTPPQAQSINTLTVNGQHIDVPENGSTEVTINDTSGTTHVSAQSSSSQSTAGGTVSNTNEFSFSINQESSP